MPKSFYELDYLIEVNEQRVEQFTSAYQKVIERFTSLIIIYSALSIFLVPIIQDIFVNDSKGWLLQLCFTLFAILFISSLYHTIRLIIPVNVAYLESPKVYYDTYRLNYERTVTTDVLEVDKLLKASYINELERAADANEQLFRRKSHFYYWALVYGLLSAMPYLICLGYHISQKEDKVQKIQLVYSNVDSSLHQNGSPMSNQSTMRRDSAQSTQHSSTSNSGSTNVTVGKGRNTVSNLPGVDSSQVIASSPKMIREDSPGATRHRR